MDNEGDNVIELGKGLTRAQKLRDNIGWSDIEDCVIIGMDEDGNMNLSATITDYYQVVYMLEHMKMAIVTGQFDERG